MDNLWMNLEAAAGLTLVRRIGYTEGYTHSETLKGFVEGDLPDVYPPLDLRYCLKRPLYAE